MTKVGDIVAQFSADVANGTLPTVSWIIASTSTSEHPPYAPTNGAYVTRQLINALNSNPALAQSTVFLLTYDENGGFYDHVVPPTPESGTADEFVSGTPIGLGARVPMIIVSPWSRGGNVCSQVFDHTSILRFLEVVTGVQCSNISAWRRAYCGDLTSAFDFAHPDNSIPSLPTVTQVSGPTKTPTPPANQSFPVQETGVKSARVLPYQLSANSYTTMSAGEFWINLVNTGTVSAHFTIYPNQFRSFEAWQYDIPAGGSFADYFHAQTYGGGKYDLSCYGPNGFLYRFAGDMNVENGQIEASAGINADGTGLMLTLKNTSAAAGDFTVYNLEEGTSNAYTVPANSSMSLPVAADSQNGGWYDLEVKVGGNPLFLRAFQGHIELNSGTPANDWKFDDASGTVASDSGYGENDATVVGATWTTGRVGGALSFNGTSSKVTCGTGPSLSGTTDFTVSAWVKTTSILGGEIIEQRDNPGYNGEYEVKLNAAGNVIFYVYGNSAYQFTGNNIVSIKKVNDGNWHLVTVLRRQDGSGQIYIDGQPDKIATGTTRSLSSSISVNIGADVRNGNNYFSGLIEDVRIYRRALSDSEIASLATLVE